MGFPGCSAGEESTCDAGDLGLIPGLGKYPGGGEGYPLQYSGLEYFMECVWPMGSQNVGCNWANITHLLRTCYVMS